VAVACEELGHHALPGPVPESVAAVPVLLATLAEQCGADESPAAQGLPGLAAGEQIATLARPPRLPYAVDADAAGLVLLADGDVLRLATAVARYPSVDPARWLWQTRAGQELARGPAAAAAAARALEAGTLACAAQLLGAGRALLEASVRQATQRSQFGQPIGSFQAVKHYLADVAIGLEFARPLLDAAAAALDDQAPGDPPRGEPGAGNKMHSARDVSAAKIACTDAAYRAARVALQVHGAIGYTQEHDLHLWLTKVRALAGAWGSQAEHRARVMAAIAGPAAWT
jgi:alkylation response protein AidB-like acyl-CoA dehydrogenase